LVELNLVPLQENMFTNCKSELKYFEAAIVGTLTVASPVYTYACAVTDEKDGHLARSYEWAGKIRSVINSMESYPEMAERAAMRAEQDYAWYRQKDRILHALLD